MLQLSAFLSDAVVVADAYDIGRSTSNGQTISQERLSDAQDAAGLAQGKELDSKPEDNASRREDSPREGGSTYQLWKAESERSDVDVAQRLTDIVGFQRLENYPYSGSEPREGLKPNCQRA